MSRPSVTGYQSFKRDTERIRQVLKSESFSDGIALPYWESIYRLAHHRNNDNALFALFGVPEAWTWPRHSNPMEVETVSRPHITIMGPGHVYTSGDENGQG